MSTRKCRKRLSIDSSSEDDNIQDKTPQHKGKQVHDCNTRSSERINRRQNRSFQIPSREDVWNKILPTKSPDKYYHLKPRKLVNNFTKENNAYNYDPNYTSGSESMDDFIDDDIQYRSRKKKKKTVHRIKQRHSRVIQESSDSDTSQADESAKETNETNRDKHSCDDREPPVNVSTCYSNSNVDEGFGEGLCLQKEQNEIQEIDNISGTCVDTCNVPDDDSDFDNILSLRKVRKKTNKIESGDEKGSNACHTVTSSITGIAKTGLTNNEIDEDFNIIDSESSITGITSNKTNVGPNITDSESSITDRNIKIDIIKEEEVKNIKHNTNDDEKLESDNDSNFEVNLQKYKRRKSNVLDSDTEDEEVDKHAGDDSSHDNAGGNTANIEDDGENIDEVIVLNDGSEVHAINSDDSNDSFVVDDDIEDDYVVVDDDEEEDFDNEDETSNDDSESDSEDESVCHRKKTVRVQMVQKKKERDNLFEQLREARNRRKSRENCENDND